MRDKINYYLDIAEVVLEKSTCLRRQFGAVIVKNDEIISTGYNGSARGCRNCNDVGECVREQLGTEKGARYDLCRAVHAEANAIISASRAELIGATLYMACHDTKTNQLYADIAPCSMCRRLIINAGIAKVITRFSKSDYHITEVTEFVKNEDSKFSGY